MVTDVLTFHDEFSKYTLAIPIGHQDAVTKAKAFVEEVVLKFGIPQMILSDQGSKFMSAVFTKVCKRLKINEIKCTAYHPQSNGTLERRHRVLVEYHTCFILKDKVIGINGYHTLPSCLTRPPYCHGIYPS
jgi:transposase InsO family protein